MTAVTLAAWIPVLVTEHGEAVVAQRPAEQFVPEVAYHEQLQ